MLKRFAFRAKMYYFVLAKRKEPETQGSFLFFCPIIKEEIHRKLEILYALADFLDALAEIFLALSVCELTM